MLNLLYITNKPEIASIVETAGVNTVFVDLEVLDKSKRQGGMDTVQSHHTIDDVRNISDTLTKAQLLVRVNHIHEDSRSEIESVIRNGADIVMLPYFKTIEEVQTFLKYVDGKAKTCLLLETKEAADMIDDILMLDDIDIIYIGLNDLHLSYGMDFMFQLLADGTVEKLLQKIKAKGITAGFGGIARLDAGMLPGSSILKEHYRLGSSMVIVSRSFCNTDIVTDLDEVRKIFESGIKDLRNLEQECQNADAEYFEENRKLVVESTAKIVEIIRKKKLQQK